MHSQARATILMLCAVVLFAAAAPPALAGIPQPGLLLYGKVYDDSKSLLTEGQLSWTFTPSDGGPPVTVVTDLRELEGPDGAYSYRVVVPMEAAVPGYPVSGDALPVAEAVVEYEQAGAVLDSAVTFTQTVILSRADVGSAKRVDICQNCDRTDAPFHSADINRDLKFSLGEFLRVLELHAATPSHEYHTSLENGDGYGVGPGPKAGVPHNSDYYGGADWRVTVHELVRMVDLFTATPDHSYHPYPNAEDGFRKGASGQKDDFGVEKSAPSSLRLRRTLGGGGSGMTGALTVTLHFDGSAGDELTGLGLSETLPAGWVYQGAAGGPAPFAAPAPGTSGALDFAWFPVPQSAFSFSYRVAFDRADTIAANLGSLQGEGIYRTRSSEGQTLLSVSPFKGAGGGVDMDGDGIDDELEEQWARVINGAPAGAWSDSDGDKIPDFLDTDSDNDGLTDFQEANHDGNPGYNPFDPVSNPDGTDINTINPDTDGDGVRDADELARGDDPRVYSDKAASVPVGGAAALVLLTGALAMAMRREFRRRDGKR